MSQFVSTSCYELEQYEIPSAMSTAFFCPNVNPETASPYVDSHIVLGREDNVQKIW